MHWFDVLVGLRILERFCGSIYPLPQFLDRAMQLNHGKFLDNGR